MICTLTARRLKPGAFDDFRSTWMPDEDQQDASSKWNPVYVCRDVDDENVIVAFGMFQGTLDELRAAQEEYGYDEAVGRVDQYVDEVLLDGAYEVIEEIRPE
jgi:hypothetical protein